MVLGPDGDIMEKMENMSKQIEEYELLVKQLKVKPSMTQLLFNIKDICLYASEFSV